MCATMEVTHVQKLDPDLVSTSDDSVFTCKVPEGETTNTPATCPF